MVDVLKDKANSHRSEAYVRRWTVTNFLYKSRASRLRPSRLSPPFPNDSDQGKISVARHKKPISYHSLSRSLLAIPTVARDIDAPGISCGAYASSGNLILHLFLFDSNTSRLNKFVSSEPARAPFFPAMLNLSNSLHSAAPKMLHLLKMMCCEHGLVMRELHRVNSSYWRPKQATCP